MRASIGLGGLDSRPAHRPRSSLVVLDLCGRSVVGTSRYWLPRGIAEAVETEAAGEPTL
jgi:hypothetical protein